MSHGKTTRAKQNKASLISNKLCSFESFALKACQELKKKAPKVRGHSAEENTALA